MWRSLTRLDRVLCLLGVAVVAAGAAGVVWAPAGAPWLRLADNLQWTAAFGIAALLAWSGVREAPAGARHARQWFAYGAYGQLVGQLLWDVQVLLRWNPFPAPSDVFYLTQGVCALVGLWWTLQASMSAMELRLARLDLATFGTAVIAVTLALYLPLGLTAPALQLLFLAGYPVFLLSAGVLGVLLVLHARPRWQWGWTALVGSLFLLGGLWMEWNARQLQGTLADGAPINVMFSVAVLLYGLGARAWEIRPSEHPRYRTVCDTLAHFLPLVAVILAAGAVVLAASLPGMPQTMRLPLGLGAAAVVLVAVVRQSFIIGEMRRAQARAEAAHGELRDYSASLEQEIAERKHAIEALQRAQEEQRLQHSWLKAVVEHFPGGVTVMDHQLRVVEHNEEFRRLLDFPREMLEGEPRSLAEFLRLNAERGEYGDIDVEAYVEQGMALARRFAPHHFERVRPDGSVLEVRGQPIPGGGFVTSYTDITARKRAEEKLRQSEELFARIFHTSPDAIGITRVSDGLYVEVNSAFEALTGYTRGEVIGRTSADIAIWPYPEQRTELVRRFREHGRVGSLEMVARRKDGSHVTGLMSVRGLRMDDDDYFLFYFRDITERKKFEETERARSAAELASRAKSEFLSRMSHELRTPLNAILGFAQILEHNPTERLSAAQRAQVQHIERAGWHLLDMINDVLDLTRIEAGKLSISIEPVRLARIVTDSLPMVESLADEMGVVVENRVGMQGQDPWVQADAMRLRQVLVNLLSNATKYNRRGGRVTIYCTADGPIASLAVQDTGTGLTDTQIAELFQPFNRVGAERTHVEGTGLGLLITRNLVEYMHGTLEVVSEPGLGTTFTVKLPVAEPLRLVPPPAPRPADADRAGLPTPADTTPRTVLYIEDNPSNALVVESMLAARPHITLALAADGPSGLEVARRVRPDLILLDINLPGMSGLEVIAELRADAATAAIPCVALSANAMPEEVANALKAGFVDYWTKPIEVTSFLARLDALLAPEATKDASSGPVPR